MQHKLRLVEALADLKIRSWPFEGRIGIRERSANRDEIHVLDNWCHLGTISDAGQLDLFRDGSNHSEFDVDIYKLLLRFMEKHGRRADVVKL